MHEGGATAEMCGDQLRLQGERAVITADGLEMASGLGERAAEVGVHRGIAGLELHSRAEQRQRLRNIAGRRGRKPQQMHGIAVARLAGEHLTAEGGGLGEAPLLLQRESLRHRSAAAGHGWRGLTRAQDADSGSAPRARSRPPAAARARARSAASDRHPRSRSAGAPAPS